MLPRVRQVTSWVPAPTTDRRVAVPSDLTLGKPGVGPMCHTPYSEDSATEHLTFPGRVLFLHAKLSWP